VTRCRRARSYTSGVRVSSQDFPHFDIDRPISRSHGTYCSKEVERVEFFKTALQTLECGTLANVNAIKNS
jgi:hypothetical protein